MENGMQMISETSSSQTCHEQTVGVVEAAANHSVSMEKDLDLMENLELFKKCFDYFQMHQNKINPNGLSLKMLKEYFPVSEVLISYPYSLKWIGGVRH